jgi:hypothetical protein
MHDVELFQRALGLEDPPRTSSSHTLKHYATTSRISTPEPASP